MSKQTPHLWSISFNIDILNIPSSTVFNSGFIDDMDIVKEYFIKTNPHVSNIVVIKVD